MSRFEPSLDFSSAFQPIVSAAEQHVVGVEALVRGRANESAYQIFSQISADELYQYDQAFRDRAIQLAARLGVRCNLNLNLLPSSLEESPQPLRATLDTAARHGLPAERVVIELTEAEIIEDVPRFSATINEFRGLGLRVAIDDFGAGYSGLNLLADFQPDSIKLDMSLVRDIHLRGPRQAIVRGICRTCDDLGIEIVAEGIESVDEYRWCCGEGIDLFQGYLFARPGFESLPAVTFPPIDPRARGSSR